MALVSVGSIDLDPSQLTGVGPIITSDPPGSGTTFYAFDIYLQHGAKTSVTSSDQAQIDQFRGDTVQALPGTRVNTGGCSFDYSSVSVIGAVFSDPSELDQGSAAFEIQLAGVGVTLRYESVDEANSQRAALVETVNG